MATNEEKAKLDASISKQGFTFDGEFYHRPDKRVLHLMVNNTCTNDCPLCCNKQYDVEDIPVVTVKELRDIDTICFTGGQPLLDLENFSTLCTCLERNFNNIKNGYVYMNGAELFSFLNPDLSRTKKLFERFPWNSRVNYGLTMSPKCRRDWNAIREFKPYLEAWKSNRIYCFSDRDVANAEGIFHLGEIEIVRREWQSNFVPAPNTFFRRLPIWIA